MLGKNSLHTSPTFMSKGINEAPFSCKSLRACDDGQQNVGLNKPNSSPYKEVWLRPVIYYRKECCKWICILMCPTVHLLLTPLFPQPPPDPIPKIVWPSWAGRVCIYHHRSWAWTNTQWTLPRPGQAILSVAFFYRDARWPRWLPHRWLPIRCTLHTTAAAWNLPRPQLPAFSGRQSWTKLLLLCFSPFLLAALHIPWLEDGENIQFTLGHQRCLGSSVSLPALFTIFLQGLGALSSSTR